jgi:hypothetical protein
MRRTILALSALALMGGCNPDDFGSALDKAPVQYIGEPSGFATNVGRTLLPLAPPTDKPKVAARLLFAGTDAPSLAVADFNGDGNPQVQLASSDELGALGLSSDVSKNGISSAAWLSPAGPIILGMPNVFPDPQGQGTPPGRVAFLNLPADASGKVAFQYARIWQDGVSTDGAPSTQPRGHFGLAVARGQVTQGTTDEAIVVADNGVSVVSVTSGLSASSTCTGALATPPDLHRSLAVANFLSGGNQEIAVGLPVKGKAGQVFILQYGIDPANPTLPAGLFCARKFGVPNSVGNAAVGGFGTALAAVPHGAGLADLVVGAPPNQVYLVYGDGRTPKVFTNKAQLDPISRKPELDPNTGNSEPDNNNDSEFGQRVALVDIDGDGTQELAVTALQADVGGTPKAGKVYVYKLDGDGTTPIAVVYDSNPIANTGYFGIGLAELEFNSSLACAPKGKDAHVLVVGDDLGIFTFFRFAGTLDLTKPIASDPRCFAQ